jgi:ferredoxin--NADP+ reductase
LVRFGVAPDHEKIKNVTRVFEKLATNPNFRFFGNVDIGNHVKLEDLKRYYDQICYATGAQSDRRMGIPGEDLRRSHPATEFVAWYNGHPDYRDYEFDLSVESVAVVGVGNVAVDVARILCRTPEELENTDIADYALEVLRGSKVKEVYVLGRRGPAQAAFTNPEVKELGEMAGADLIVLPGEVELDALSRSALEESSDKTTLKKVEILQSAAARAVTGKPRRLTLRFLVSPVELYGNEGGEVAGMRLVRNELYVSDDGSLRPRPIESFEELEVDMVFRSVGYRGVPLEGLPFHDRWGIVPNESGRVTDGQGGDTLQGIYVAGWIKRGPSGVIGTNKPDAGETVDCMLQDVAEGRVLNPATPDPAAAENMVRSAQPSCISWGDWRSIQEIEDARGAELGRPRLKMTSVEDMLAALQRV